MSTNTNPGVAEKLLDDTAITTKIKAKFLADELINVFDIKVTTEDSNVILRGNVPSQKAVDQAIEIAKNTAGVNKVISKIAVKL